MKKIIVCGTGFGKYYLKAIKSMQKEVELVGILSRGSKQSAACARELFVPLYTSLEQLDEVEIDIACVVIKSEIVGGNGSNLVQYFLKRGVHVFQEHPVHYDMYASSIKLARQRNCCYFMNTFYPYLKSVDVFLKAIERLKKETKINYVCAECGIQVLFPLIDILGRVTGNMSALRIDKELIDEKQMPFAVVRGSIGTVPFILLVKNEMNIEKAESNIALLHQINVNTSCGNLTLTDVHGQVVWTPVIHEDLKSGEGKKFFSDIPMQQSLINSTEYTLENIFDTLWPDSIRRSLRMFIDKIETGTNMASIHQHYLCVCKAWNEIGNMLGNYKPVSYEITRPIKLEMVEEEKL